MTIDWKKSARLLKGRLPVFILDDSPLFAHFLTAYYEWLDRTDNANHLIQNFQQNRDIDLTEESLIDKFLAEFMPLMPRTIVADEALVLKHIKQFYRARGSEKSAKFLFRILFDEEIEFYYPGVDMFRPSHSRWTIEKSLKVLPNISDINIADIGNKRIIGNGTGAHSRVEKVISYFDNQQRFIYEIFYGKSVGDFANGEILSVDNMNVATIVELVTYPGVHTTFDGHCSNAKKLQDSRYYQEFSYVIRSNISFPTYERAVKDLIHPAGTRLFGELAINTDFPTLTPEITSEGLIRIFDISLTETIPIIDVELFFGELGGSQNELDIEILMATEQADNPQQMTTEVYPFANDNVQIPGNFFVVYHPTPESIDNFLGYEFEEWLGDDFFSRRGIMAINEANNNWLATLANNVNVYVVDNLGFEQPSNNTIQVVGSDRIILLVNPVPSVLANAHFELRT